MASVYKYGYNNQFVYFWRSNVYKANQSVKNVECKKWNVFNQQCTNICISHKDVNFYITYFRIFKWFRVKKSLKKWWYVDYYDILVAWIWGRQENIWTRCFKIGEVWFYMVSLQMQSEVYLSILQGIKYLTNFCLPICVFLESPVLFSIWTTTPQSLDKFGQTFKELFFMNTKWIWTYRKGWYVSFQELVNSKFSMANSSQINLLMVHIF